MDATTLTFVAVVLAGAVFAWVASARAREEEYRRRVRWAIRRGM